MRILLLFLNVFLFHSGIAQPGTLKIDSFALVNLEGRLQIMADAMVDGNYDLMVDCTYPSLIKKGGGRALMVEKITSQMEEMEKQGISFKDISFARPLKFVKAGTEIHTLIPESVLMNVPGGILKSNSYLIGITGDKGKSWYFVDTSNITNANVRQILPNYNLSLKIPAKQDPIMIGDK
jgi:hypothetical protein